MRIDGAVPLARPQAKPTSTASSEARSVTSSAML